MLTNKSNNARAIYTN